MQMKIDMKKKILSITRTNERKRMLQSKLTLVEMLKQIFIMKIEKEFDEKKILQVIIDEKVEKKSKKRR
jgi:hypothetical protein